MFGLNVSRQGYEPHPAVPGWYAPQAELRLRVCEYDVYSLISASPVMYTIAISDVFFGQGYAEFTRLRCHD
jgi:hypothetical protein